MAPIPALSTKESVTMLRALMPQRRAASRLEAQARICRPRGVARKKMPSSTTIVPQTPITQSTCGEILAPASAIALTASPVKCGSACDFSSQTWRAISRMTIETPMVMMIMRSTVGRCSQRMKSTSIAAPTSIVTATAPRIATGSGAYRCSVTAVIPPIIRNSPWAKLMMPVVL